MREIKIWDSITVDNTVNKFQFLSCIYRIIVRKHGGYMDM